MKRIEGYSLAEVILTLAIVGAIIALTVPTMINNSNNDQFVAGLKNNYALLSEVADQLLEEAGGDFTGYFANTDDLKNKFIAKLSVIKNCTLSQTEGNCWHNGKPNWKTLSGGQGWIFTNTFSGIVLRNGSLAAFNLTAGDCNNNGFKWNGVNAQCGHILIDVNGFKGPNTGGRDVFQFKIAKNGLFPAGSEGESAYNDANPSDPWNLKCKIDSADYENGKACAGKVLIEGKMNY